MNDQLDKQNASRQSNICLLIMNYIFFLTKTFKKRIKKCFRLSFKTQSWIEYFGRYTDIKKCIEKPLYVTSSSSSLLFWVTLHCTVAEQPWTECTNQWKMNFNPDNSK